MAALTSRPKFPGHLLIVTVEDPFDPASWSGTAYNMREALEASIERVSVLSKLKPKRTLINGALRLVLGGKPPRYPLYLTPAAQKQFARETEAAIRAYRPDAILSISSHCLLYLPDPGVPVFMVADAPWMTWKETYSEYESLPLLGRRFAKLEAAAARRCAKLIFSSEWATDEARRLYGVPPEKLCVQPMGANWIPSENREQLSQIIQSRSQDELKLLFVGKDWERKGGPLTLEVARGLRAAGVKKVRVHIVGGDPPIPADLQDIVTVHGLLRRSDPDESEKLRQLFLKSHFLIVPTHAECFGVVFAEAHAFGLPAVSRAVHAVPSIIEDGETGIVLAANDAAPKYVERILAIAKDRDAYLRMAHAARARYETKLNWQSFADAVANQMKLSLEPSVS
jgi:glycosyltransferase involved in cell wall biosynthesis